MTIPDDATSETKSQRMLLDTSDTPPIGAPPTWSLGIVAPTDPRGRHELLRLTAGLAPYLYGSTGDTIVAGIAALGIEPVHVERVVSSMREYGVIAIVNGVLYALGVRSFLEDIGLHPHQADLRIAERIERAGDTPFFVVAIARTHCIGVLGGPSRVHPFTHTPSIEDR
jgi:cation transport ATPase